MRSRIAIVIPAFNEEPTLAEVIAKIKKCLSQEYDYRIFVVDDGSDDRTSDVAADSGAEVARHPFPTGVGGATKTGFLMARTWNPDIIVQIDADGQHEPEELRKFFHEIETQGCDLVIGSRFLKTDPEMSAVRKRGIRFFTWLVNRLTGYNLTDITNGYRAFRAELLDEVYFSAEKNWAIEMTLRASRCGLRVKEVPVTNIGRIKGQSQFNNLSAFVAYPVRAIMQIITVYSK